MLLAGSRIRANSVSLGLGACREYSAPQVALPTLSERVGERSRCYRFAREMRSRAGARHQSELLHRGEHRRPRLDG